MKTRLKIQGMHCNACTQRVTESLQRLPGVVGARVTLDPPEAEIESTAPLDRGALARAARAAGDYSITEMPASGAEAAQGHQHDHHPQGATADPKPSLYPLGLILLSIAGTVALTTSFRGNGDLHTLMNDFMAGFFLVFSFFKLLDVRGFADTYRSYDIVARAWKPWGFVYPFIELGLGVAYLVGWHPGVTNTVTLALMLVGSVGVLRALARKDRIRCACLGTALNLPMTTVTLTEDLVMAVMAAAMLVWQY